MIQSLRSPPFTPMNYTFSAYETKRRNDKKFNERVIESCTIIKCVVLHEQAKSWEFSLITDCDVWKCKTFVVCSSELGPARICRFRRFWKLLTTKKKANRHCFYVIMRNSLKIQFRWIFTQSYLLVKLTWSMCSWTGSKKFLLTQLQLDLSEKWNLSNKSGTVRSFSFFWWPLLSRLSDEQLTNNLLFIAQTSFISNPLRYSIMFWAQTMPSLSWIFVHCDPITSTLNSSKMSSIRVRFS